MQLDFTEDQEALRDSVRSVLEKECPPSLVRDVVEQGVRPDALEKTVRSLDWPALTIPEADGGIGLGVVELAVLSEELGRVLAPGTLLPTISQLAPVIRECGTAEQRQRFGAAIAAGDLTGALVLATPDGSFDPAATEVTATADADGWLLSGRTSFVVEATNVDELAVVARVAGSTGDAGIGVWLVPRADVAVTPLTSFEQSRTYAAVQLTDVEVPADRCLGEPGLTALHGLHRAIEEATVATALEAVGACQRLFEMTLDYAKERHQFGVPIGSFQAIKHKLADCLVAIERARATCYFAAVAIAEDDDRRSLATSMAKATAGDMQRLLAKESVQIHGGIGYMWETDVQLYVKRAKAAELLFGGASTHRAKVATHLGL